MYVNVYFTLIWITQLSALVYNASTVFKSTAVKILLHLIYNIANQKTIVLTLEF